MLVPSFLRSLCSWVLIFQKLAATLSEVLGRPITHVNWSEEQIYKRFVSRGMDERYAKILSSMDTRIAQGAEEIQNDVVEKVTGRKPMTFRRFAEVKKGVWQ